MLTDEAYAKVLDNIVVGCVDVAITHKGMILLERRINDPIKNEWWIFGGRVIIGETFQETAKRGLLRELGVNIQDETRFLQLPAMNLRWPTRRETPIENGCHHLLVPHCIEITDLEKAFLDQLIRADSQKKWFSTKAHENDIFLPEIDVIINNINNKA